MVWIGQSWGLDPDYGLPISDFGTDSHGSPEDEACRFWWIFCSMTTGSKLVIQLVKYDINMKYTLNNSTSYYSLNVFCIHQVGIVSFAGFLSWTSVTSHISDKSSLSSPGWVRVSKQLYRLPVQAVQVEPYLHLLLGSNLSWVYEGRRNWGDVIKEAVKPAQGRGCWRGVFFNLPNILKMHNVLNFAWLMWRSLDIFLNLTK